MTTLSRFIHIALILIMGSLTRASAHSLWAGEANPTTASESAEPATPTDALAGHSRHGEVFNEGPRQSAYLMPGTGAVTFKVTTQVPLVRKLIEQGIGQLHGFWYFEAERTFRQAAMLDPKCAIAYWGMALANGNNRDRAKEFVDRALELKGEASSREQRYITALHEFLHGTKKRSKREAGYVEALEALVEDYPDDLEAKALLGYALYRYRGSAKKSHADVDVILDAVLAKEPLHPVHHYRIHLWDHKSPQRALDSAAKCGPSASSIAHMWHMCGHIFSRVKRFGDAAWFQEASARVDHRHMMHDRVLPDQIHNFAHNNEWLIRNLMNVGRVRDAVDLAKNMIELPRHPKYNTLDNRHSASYGRERLLNVLVRYELWDELIDLAHGPYLEPTEKPAEQLRRLRYLGEAYARRGELALAEGVVAGIQEQLDGLPARILEADGNPNGQPGRSENRDRADDSEKRSAESQDAEREKKKDEEFKEDVERHERAIACVSGYMAAAKGDYAQALSLLEKADADGLSLARARLLAGDPEQAVEQALDYAKDRRNQVRPLAGLIEICWTAGRQKQALEAFVRLRANSRWIQMESPVFTRLEPIAEELGLPPDWRVAQPDPDDLGQRPALDSLGLFRWQPAPAPGWLLPDAQGRLHGLDTYRGRPLIVVFYLGYGCLHCAEQLQALGPRAEDFAREGISLIAISTDDLKGLDRSQRNYRGDKIPIPLVANPELDVFKAYRAYDDFENLPLHGTFLIDGKGRIRWQDISYDPFMDIDFLLSEAKRLLAQDNWLVPR